MIWIIVGLALLTLNAYFGVRDVKLGKTNKSSAFTWFVVGVVAFSILDQIVALL